MCAPSTQERSWEGRGGRVTSGTWCMLRASVGYCDHMSDLEHEMIVEQVQTQREADEMRRLARQALVAAESAQEAAYGRHDPWIDAALRVTTRVH